MNRKKQHGKESGQGSLSLLFRVEKIFNNKVLYKGLLFLFLISCCIGCLYISNDLRHDNNNKIIMEELRNIKDTTGLTTSDLIATHQVHQAEGNSTGISLKEKKEKVTSHTEDADTKNKDVYTGELKYNNEIRFPMAGVAIDLSCINSVMMERYRRLYQVNSHLIGWLTIDDTIIDYPVMQTMDNENYYLDKDFYQKNNKNGSLIMDTDSVVGSGTRDWYYKNGSEPSTNLIIHGHTMKSGEMFGDLEKYAEEEYGKEHKIIQFDSLYESRKYELISVFYSQVFYADEDVFKYYKFFQAETKEEFDEWYGNIKSMSLYDTGVTSVYGDEFITLSACAYHVEEGRFVVVAKRIE